MRVLRVVPVGLYLDLWVEDFHIFVYVCEPALEQETNAGIARTFVVCQARRACRMLNYVLKSAQISELNFAAAVESAACDETEVLSTHVNTNSRNGCELYITYRRAWAHSHTIQAYWRKGKRACCGSPTDVELRR